MAKNKTATILSIDDDAQIRYSLAELFATQGWQTISAGDVTTGLKLFNENHPDIVLMDYHMPDINGIWGVQMVRALDTKVPIIVFTIDESQRVADEFLAAGATDFALKPIKAPDLISRINLHLRLSELRVEEKAAPAGFVNKGIGEPTLKLILNYFHEHEGYLIADDIAKGTGLAYQTVYRYLQYLVKEERLATQASYGKIGRPRQSYRLNDNKAND